jgi:hypothetical protein
MTTKTESANGACAARELVRNAAIRLILFSRDAAMRPQFQSKPETLRFPFPETDRAFAKAIAWVAETRASTNCYL